MNAMYRAAVRAGLAFSALSMALAANAGVQIDGTRVIFNEGMPEATIRVSNKNDVPVLLQSWVDTLDVSATPSSTSAPFLVLPPISRVDAGKVQVLRMRLTSQSLPKEQESAFWLNILEVPAVASERAANDGQLQVTVRNRIKIFYRPEGLSTQGAGRAAGNVQWTLSTSADGATLHAKNDSPYHVSMVKAWVADGQKLIEAEGMQMLAPHADISFKLPGMGRLPSDATLKIRYINDFGGVVNTTMPLAMP
ncbi:fimbria/pilus periplasmic chaperone [Stenotrophomonas maltophilia]|uniref:Fimbria/pilus periplasmic chaperone n=1 Tax=Stenotrophomonas riyadhensis TaxID=2859893 RepID=A0ABT2XCR6_9GAMM|nr:fimbria/pilus periplasmic chaperone [Stenotrophomonas sp. CFS3442]MBH1619502.1 fimbria/pilus periplasmic chaperone [Stenotrophomonas maltophilia]MCV0323732.1 fimbria/pilus periplasmic chaperone [Stenotrophomonas sp. CFS3442]HEL4244669.1 fimbria/pilus periplasmic chaperone [Stenotrophomonas maltophilia]